VLRIKDVRPSTIVATPRTPPPELSGGRAFVGRSNVTTVRVAIPESDLGLVARYATTPVELLGEGRAIVTLDVANRQWLGRLLLRVGPGAEVIDPPEFKKVAAEEARRALDRYQPPANT
jgi:predicted DNA-binding transcriptional regulator YafY